MPSTHPSIHPPNPSQVVVGCMIRVEQLTTDGKPDVYLRTASEFVTPHLFSAIIKNHFS